MLKKCTEIKFVDALYPRKQFDQETVNKYRQAIDNLPPIVISHEGFLIDGYHRLIAHKIELRDTINVVSEEIDQEAILWESAKRNAAHGLQLSQSDKSSLGRAFYKQGKTVEEIANVLSVSRQAVDGWTKDIRKAENDERDQKIIDMYLACHTWEEIAEVTGYEDHSGPLKRFESIVKNAKLSEIHTPTTFQLFNIWKFQDNDDRYGMDYPGRIPGQIVENLLYYYTEPFDKVIDPFAGGGTTIDVCKAYYRRYLAYDINPVREDIKKCDITSGFPAECKKAKLIFLDPPYWKQKRGSYSEHQNNLANFDLPEFYAALENIFIAAKEILAENGYIAVIIGPTQEGGKIYDHALEVARLLEKHYQYHNRIIVPYTTQQHSGAYVSSAKDNKTMLYLFRDLMVFRNG